MNILQVISSADPAHGGVMEGTRQTSLVLAQMGHSVEVASADDPAAPWLDSLGLTLHALGPHRSAYYYAPRMLPWLHANTARFDAVIVNGLWQFPGFAVRRALRGAPTPYFVYTHGMLDPWFKRTYPLKHLKKCLYWPWGEYRVLRDAEAVLFTCEEEKVLARQSFGLYRANEAVVSLGTAGPPGDVAGQEAAFLSRHSELRGKRLLLFLGRIHAKKGCDLLVEAFAKVAATDPDLRLVMAGPDSSGLGAQLARRADALGGKGRVVWPGMLTGDVKWGAFRAAEAFVLPSHQENFGVAVAEALACGLPVLISDKVNIWREIQQDGAGLVEQDTPAGTERLLRGWLALSAPARETMAARARHCFESRFEIRMAADRLLAALRAPRAGNHGEDREKKESNVHHPSRG